MTMTHNADVGVESSPYDLIRTLDPLEARELLLDYIERQESDEAFTDYVLTEVPEFPLEKPAHFLVDQAQVEEDLDPGKLPVTVEMNSSGVHIYCPNTNNRLGVTVELHNGQLRVLCYGDDSIQSEDGKPLAYVVARDAALAYLRAQQLAIEVASMDPGIFLLPYFQVEMQVLWMNGTWSHEDYVYVVADPILVPDVEVAAIDFYSALLCEQNNQEVSEVGVYNLPEEPCLPEDSTETEEE